MKEFILSHAPIFVQNAAISVFNRHQWWERQRGDYQGWLDLCQQARNWDVDKWSAYQSKLLEEFLKFAVTHSAHYGHLASDTKLSGFPVLEKKTIVENLDRISTLRASDGIVSHTGGTTGASMKVIYTRSDMQKRQAVLGWFRGLYGWSLGRRTAWFSGKSILRDRDIAKGICYRDDWLTRTRFFSTFHITPANFDAYWQALIDFNPEYMVGFPSSIGDILAMARDRGLTYPHRVRAVFPTAETVLQSHRELFHDVLGAETRDQYASSEGAPFIVECPAGGLHILPHTGIFEVVDEAGQPAREGELLVTSFHTHGTPLIRYRIGDRIRLAPDGQQCSCGWSFPMVERIEGRNADFIWSRERGRISSVNLANATKGIPGIMTFRVIQDLPDAITVEIQAGSDFDPEAAVAFENELRKRTGDAMQISLVTRDVIERQSSGKFRIVDNRLSKEEMGGA